MRESIRRLDLDLTDLTVLTEAASSYYVCTPIIAAMSGARHVFALAKDSPYGATGTLIQNVKAMAESVGLSDSIECIDGIDHDVIQQTDIVTNLGFLRPIIRHFITQMKTTAVIPLMRETWEFREGEIDLDACREKGIVVLGTNENHLSLRIFDYLGPLCAKILLEAQIEVLKSKIVVFGGGDFGLNIMDYLSRMGSEVLGVCEEEPDGLEQMGVQKIGSLSDPTSYLDKLSDVDAVIITTYPNKTEIIGRNGLIKTSELKEICPGVTIVQFKGNVDRESIQRHGLRILPDHAPKEGHMSWTLNALGPKPVIDLHTAGLKVGEIASRLRQSGLSPEECLKRASQNALVQKFDNAQNVVRK